MRIAVEVDEEFTKALEVIEQPYLDRQALIKILLLSELKQYRIELAIKNLQEKGVEMHYSEKSLREDLE
jgi:hypothetical protein